MAAPPRANESSVQKVEPSGCLAALAHVIGGFFFCLNALDPPGHVQMDRYSYCLDSIIGYYHITGSRAEERRILKLNCIRPEERD